MKQSVLILTGSHLCHNPRVIKEATALAAAGYQVEVLGGWMDAGLKAQDQELATRLRIHFHPVLDWTVNSPASRLRRFWGRARMKLGQAAHARTGRENAWQVGYCMSELLKAARRSKADLLIAHSEQALWAVAKSRKLKAESRKQKTRIGVDMEDWFSEDLLPEARKNRPVKLLRSLEQRVLRKAAHAACTSRAMSEALAKEYGCRPPTVIYNAFPWADRKSIDGLVKDRVDQNRPSLHWYSQTLGTGRGLEDLFAALPHVKHEVEIHLRGKPVSGFESWLASHVPEAWRKHIFIHDLVSNDELLSRIAEHDIGFAGEMKYSRSRDLTVTNKILHYLLGGLAVVASDTAGQREIANQASSAVWLYPSGKAQKLAEQLNLLLGSPDRLRTAKAAALRAAEEKFCWENIAPLLVGSVEDAFRPQ